eukprot:TRINITY_DN6911_c0_g3_i1.p1 TRINITY_DN6911_c0_g3~~TRINITY_DN6911_c0_g3_i1.p1  ORF type:complete len:476 (+),score=115.98 TRINITY_DN6911_c0_g3_i1:1288-2715(+)
MLREVLAQTRSGRVDLGISLANTLYLRQAVVSTQSTGIKEPRQYRTLLAEDKVCLPMKFPGPLFQNEFAPTLRVTWPEAANHLITPEEYKSLKVIPELVDNGVNLFDELLAPSADAVINRAIGAGVTQMILISVNPTTSQFSVDKAASRLNTLFATVGVHPDDAQVIPFEDIARIRELATKPNVVAIGECGIDYTRASHSRRAKTVSAEDIEINLTKQEKWLEQQIELALELDMKLFFHEREGHTRFMKIISKYGDKLKGRAVMNCFTGTAEELDVYLQLGFYIGVTGFLCNQARGEELKAMLKKIPLDRVMLGSDAPYLIPFSMPKPYPKFNEPAYLPHVLVIAADAMGVSIAELAEASTRNCRNFFGLPTLPYDGTIRGFKDYSSNAIQAVAKVRAIRAKTEKKEGEEETKEGKEAKAEEEEEKEDPNVFEWKNKKYQCTPKEKSILTKLLPKLDDDAFAESIADFELKEITS